MNQQFLYIIRILILEVEYFKISWIPGIKDIFEKIQFLKMIA